MSVLSKIKKLVGRESSDGSLPYECPECGTRFKTDYIECPQCDSFQIERVD